MIVYPRPLTTGMTIGVTGPSGGVRPIHHRRLDLAIGHLKSQGFKIVEGECLRSENKHVSGPKLHRAQDFMRLWTHPEIDMIFPPWGGELLIEVLPLLDFDLIKKTPKWILGYSDTSTLLAAITLMTDIATAHGCNLMDSIPTQNDSLTAKALSYLGTSQGGCFVQHSSQFWQRKWTDLEKEPEVPFNLTETTVWKALHNKSGKIEFSGRLIGGCLDTLACLTGTKFGDVPAFARRHRADKIIVYLENCEQQPCSFSRILWNFRLAGWFENCSGIILGRSSGPDKEKDTQLKYEEAIGQVLSDLGVPVIFDADIGHLPPQMTLINGAIAQVRFESGTGSIEQKFG